METTENPRPTRHRKQSPNKPSQLDKLRPSDTPLAVAFRKIEPTWRNYIEYVDLAAREGDDDMRKVLAAYKGLPRREQTTIMPEQLCDLAGVKPGALVGSVSRCYWEHKQQESSISMSSVHPKMVEAVAAMGALFPECFKDREMIFRLTGSLPDKKGASITVNNNIQSANLQSPAGASGFRTMDQRVIEMGKVLEAPDEENGMPMFATNTGDVLETVDIEED